MPFIRAVSYHDTPQIHSQNFEKHLEWFSENFVNCDKFDLEDFLRTGRWVHKKPGLIISFDDGLRSNYSVAAPLLESYGFTGWFMVPAIVPSIGVGRDRCFANQALIPFTEENQRERLFMSWNDLKELSSRNHEIVCHSMNHVRLGDSLNITQLDEEIRVAKHLMQEQLNRSIQSFAWVGGEDFSFSSAAFEMMISSGYKYIFSTNCFPILPQQTPLSLERSHLDVTFDLNDVRLAIGCAYDLLYRAKRMRITQVIGL